MYDFRSLALNNGSLLQSCPLKNDSYIFNCLEYTHGVVHEFIGGDLIDFFCKFKFRATGDMNDTATASNDPIFYMHHTFIDYIWEAWRQEKQVRQ